MPKRKKPPHTILEVEVANVLVAEVEWRCWNWPRGSRGRSDDVEWEKIEGEVREERRQVKSLAEEIWETGRARRSSETELREAREACAREAIDRCLRRRSRVNRGNDVGKVSASKGARDELYFDIRNWQKRKTRTSNAWEITIGYWKETESSAKVVKGLKSQKSQKIAKLKRNPFSFTYVFGLLGHPGLPRSSLPSSHGCFRDVHSLVRSNLRHFYPAAPSSVPRLLLSASTIRFTACRDVNLTVAQSYLTQRKDKGKTCNGLSTLRPWLVNFLSPLECHSASLTASWGVKSCFRGRICNAADSRALLNRRVPNNLSPLCP